MISNQLSKISSKLLLISLIASSLLSCKVEGLPDKPDFLLYQPIIKEFCEGDTCSEMSYCNVWHRVEGEWKVKSDLEIEACNNILGVNTEDFNKIRNYTDKVESFIKQKCVGAQ